MEPRSRDDMVFSPTAEALGTVGGARSQIRQQRRIDRIMRKRHGRLARMARVRAATKRRRIVRAARSRVGSSLARRGASRILMTPPGWVIAALVVLGAVVLRLATGRSYENIGQKINDVILGDLDDEARALIAARGEVIQDGGLMEQIAREDKIGSHARRLLAYHTRRARIEQKAWAAIMRDKDMQVNGILDMIVIRLADGVKEFFTKGAGKAEVDKLKQAYARASGSPGATRSSR